MRLYAGLVCAIFIFQLAPARSDEARTIDLLHEAVAKAAALEGVRYAFTVDHWGSENDNETEWNARFDPRRDVGDQWRLVGIETDNLDKKARKTLERLQKIENVDNQLVYDKLSELIEGAALQSETESNAVFVAPLEDEELPSGVMEAEITLNKTIGYVSRIIVRSIAEFKPVALVKVKSVLQSQTFAAPVGAGPAFLMRSENASEGKAFFKKFNSQRREIISNIVEIDPADLPAQNDKTVSPS